MFHYKIAILHAKSVLLKSLTKSRFVVKTLFPSILIYVFFFFIFFFKFSIYKFSKLIVFINFWKKFVYLFANSELVNGQFPPTFITLFLMSPM
jgi:hypothetical protein